MSGKSSNPRWRAARAVGDVLDRGANLDETGALRPEQGQDARDAAFARHLAYGALRWLGALDWLARQLLDKPLKKRDGDIHRLILIGLFELWKDDSAAHAAVHEAAECARLARKPWAVGLINAVLRRFQREREAWLERLGERPERFSHPGWLLDALQAEWPEHWPSVLEANNRQAGMWLRVNRLRASVAGVAEALNRAGHETRGHDHAPEALEVITPAPVESLPGFEQGHWAVQDPAAQLAPDWLGARAEERILDACAAPGGKTCHILEFAPQAQVVALDQSETRLERVRDNARRLGHLDGDSGPGRLTIVAGDAREPDAWFDGTPFDRILLDAPCSATGVIRRHPEIKWLRTPGQVEEAVALQAELLHGLWPLLRPGGILVYATCSVLGDENGQQISRFLESRDDAQAESRDLPYGHPRGAGRQILPGEAAMDGFFYARLRKSA